LLEPPETVQRPDYAAKTHILSSPVYYHSYMLGDMFATQIYHYAAHNVLGLPESEMTCFFERPAAGKWLIANVFGPGNLYQWNELTRRATGEPLSAKYFAAELED
jgi:peptidyl-dipeptidase A